MNHLISVTLIPNNGINVILDKELFLGNFIEKAEEALDSLPVGCAIEIIYDHVDTDLNGKVKKQKCCRCIVRQKSRGEFIKTIEINPINKKARLFAQRIRIHGINY